jgi:hypothetical protein
MTFVSFGQALSTLQSAFSSSLHFLSLVAQWSPSFPAAYFSTMWQDDEDNNPYGSFNNQDPSGAPTNAAMSTSCNAAQTFTLEQR